MKTVLPLRYVLIPSITAWGMVFISASFSLKTSIDDWIEVFAWASVFAMVGAVLTTFLITPFIAKVARGEPFYLREYSQNEKVQFVVRAENKEGTQVDFFQGLTPEQWRNVSLRLQAHIRSGNRSFPYAIVGQTERPILVPIMFAAGYIKPCGNGEYNLTELGISWWLSLAREEYPYGGVPEKIRKLWNL